MSICDANNLDEMIKEYLAVKSTTTLEAGGSLSTETGEHIMNMLIEFFVCNKVQYTRLFKLEN